MRHPKRRFTQPNWIGTMAGLPDQPEALDAIVDRYSVILCDVWGVVHNGIRTYRAAAAALQRARSGGLIVVLVTNAPRPHGAIEQQLDQLGVDRDSWDRVVTSGDVTRALIRSCPKRIFHLGPERCLSLFEGLDVSLETEDAAEAIVCTGFFDDETEIPEDYADLLTRFHRRDLPFVCANPDIVVERGERLIWCAGALARDYAALGGQTLIAGKPHRPIYVEALLQASKLLGRPVQPAETLAIGDGVATDVAGAQENGIDMLYISGGIHARDYGDVHDPDPQLLAAFLANHNSIPVATMPSLR